MKYIIVVPDGMADEPVDELNGKTPLEVANTTNMDYLAKNGFTGLVQTIPTGMHPGSDVGNMSILGYDPKTYLTGRAPLEAANQNIMLADDEIVFRCNLVMVDQNKMIDHSAGHIPTEEAALLVDALNKEIGLDYIKFYTGKSYRHLLVLKVRNPKDFSKIKTHAPHDILEQDIGKYLPSGKESELLLSLMERSKSVLKNHAVNQARAGSKQRTATMIWLWGQGTRPQLPAFSEKYGLKGGIISAVDLVNGLGRLAQLEVIEVPGITGYYDTNYIGKAAYALESLKTNDYVYIHIEAPDEAGHNGDPKAKTECIEKIDKEIIGTILNYYDKHDDIRILVLPDHPTPVALRTHTSDPVGFVMYGKGIPLDGSDVFNETTAGAKGLKFKSGEELIHYFIKKNI